MQDEVLLHSFEAGEICLYMLLLNDCIMWNMRSNNSYPFLEPLLNRELALRRRQWGISLSPLPSIVWCLYFLYFFLAVVMYWMRKCGASCFHSVCAGAAWDRLFCSAVIRMAQSVSLQKPDTNCKASSLQQNLEGCLATWLCLLVGPCCCVLSSDLVLEWVFQLSVLGCFLWPWWRKRWYRCLDAVCVLYGIQL